MQIIIENNEVVEAVKLYLLHRYGLIVEDPEEIDPYSSIEKRWTAEAPMSENPPRPVVDLRGATEWLPVFNPDDVLRRRPQPARDVKASANEEGCMRDREKSRRYGR